MKILLISDDDYILGRLNETNGLYNFGTIQIEFLHYQNLEDITQIQTKLKENRYHLVLAVLASEFRGSYVENCSLVNSVNHYINPIELSDSKYIDEPYKKNALPSIVNKTTSYFNVFLDIPKSVSLTNNLESYDMNIRRLDIISFSNYYLAYLCHQSKAAYYILNYKTSFPIPEILDILEKIE